MVAVEVMLVVAAVWAVVVALSVVNQVVHPPKSRNAPYGAYLTSYRKDDNRNSGFNSLSGQSDVYNNRASTLDRRQATIDNVHNDLRANRERGKIDGARDRA